MKRKGFFMVFLILMVMGVTVNAKNYEVKTEDKANYIVVTEFEKDVICNIQVIKPEQKTDLFEFSSDAEKITAYSVSDTGIKKEEANEKKEIVKEDREFPEVYDIEKDANRAIMVVSSVSNVYENEESLCEVKVLFHGEELRYLLSEEVYLNAVPKAYAELSGESTYSLKKGDIIKLNALFSGKVKSVDLIFRPAKNNPVFSDTDFGDGFSDLFSLNGMVAGEPAYGVLTPDNDKRSKEYSYAFGIVKDYNNFELQICDKNGDILTVDVANKAICYNADKEEKFEPEKAGLASIRRGMASKTAFDEDDNFIGWDEEESYDYAFLRMVGNEATEVVLYKNY